MQFTVTIPDELADYVSQADISANLASIIRDNARRTLTATAMAQVTNQVQDQLGTIDQASSGIDVQVNG